MISSESLPPEQTKRALTLAWDKILIFAVSLFLFILAIDMMKEGASSLAPFMRNTLKINNPINCLGFGWIFAYIIMSGSPVAASALAFLDTGTISQLEAFMMINGSRLGSGVIVLFIGSIYVLRGRDRATNLSMGLLTLFVTETTYVVGLFIGLALLNAHVLDAYQIGSDFWITSLLDTIYGPIMGYLRGVMPLWMFFPAGLGAILGSFNLFDRCLPQMTIRESQVGRVSRLVYRPWVMFALGAAITLISMSVSVSISILLPLSNRGFIRRENVVPYIMGANITTFIDTMLAAILLNNPAAFTLVLVEVTSITLVSVIILLFFYRTYERWMLNYVNWLLAHPRNLTFFLVLVIIIPLLFLLIS